VRLDERRKDKVVRITNKRDLAKQLKQFLRKA
jgi:hypothetical protein